MVSKLLSKEKQIIGPKEFNPAESNIFGGFSNSPVQNLLNSTRAKLEESVFDNPLMSILQPAQASLPELVVMRQIQEQQEQMESRAAGLRGK